MWFSKSVSGNGCAEAAFASSAGVRVVSSSFLLALLYLQSWIAISRDGGGISFFL